MFSDPAGEDEQVDPIEGGHHGCLGRGAADWQGTEERLAARAMMGRIGEPEDIANAVVFLVSPESGWITAQMLTVDGGRVDYIGHG